MTRFSQRQLLWIGVVLVLVLMISQLVVRPLLRSRGNLDARIERNEQRLQELIGLEKKYRQARAENDRLEQRLANRRNDFNLFAFLEGLAGRDGVKQQIEFMRPSQKPISESYQEEQVELRLKGVSLERLVPYIYHIETAPEQVRIKRVSIRPNRRDRSLLEVDMVLVTRGLRKKPGAPSAKAAQSLSKNGTS